MKLLLKHEAAQSSQPMKDKDKYFIDDGRGGTDSQLI